MNVVVENLPNCITTLHIELEPEKVSRVWDEVTSDFSKHARIPGYRLGKAPKAVVEKKFKKEIREELEKKLLSGACKEAIQEKHLRVLSLTQIDDVELADDKSMKFTATLITHPDFQLPIYKGVVVPMRSTEVTDGEVDEWFNDLRSQAADYVDMKEDRGAAMEDYLVVDYRGTIDGKPVNELFPKAGKPLSGDDDLPIYMTPETFFPGFAAALVGARPGETRNFEIEVPADFPLEGLPGQKIQYTVTVKEIKTRVLPELDDAFASTVVKDKTLEELRTMAREELSRRKIAEMEARKRQDIMTQLLSQVECELPVDMVRTETRRVLADVVRENQARGVGEDILKENEQQLVGSAAENARQHLKSTFILLRIGEAEGIKVTQEEFNRRIVQLAIRHDLKPDKLLKKLDERNALDQVTEEILTAKVLDFLSASASVTTAAAGV